MSVLGAAGGTVKPPYDPAKALEGMFKGAVIRIAQSLRDPKNYGANTSIVLPEVTKRYHDAIDDIEIQLLEAKWNLEAKLTANRAARASKDAADTLETASAKRKRAEEEIKNTTQDDSPAKRLKTEEVKEDHTVGDSVPPQDATETDGTSQIDIVKSEKVQQPANSPAATNMLGSASNEIKQGTPQPSTPQNLITSAQSTKAEPPPSKPPETARISTGDPPAQLSSKDDKQDTPLENEFESMFDLPTGDAQDNLDTDMNFDDALDKDLNINKMGLPSAQNDSSLNSLLPGLDDYAHQAQDGSNLAGIARPESAAPTGLPPDGMGDLGNDFDLPDFGGPNEFDDLLNDSFDLIDSTNAEQSTLSNGFDDLFGDG